MKKYNIVVVLAFLLTYCNNHKFDKFSKNKDEINEIDILSTDPLIVNTDPDISYNNLIKDTEEKNESYEIDLTTDTIDLIDTYDKNKNSIKKGTLLKKNSLKAKKYNTLSETEKDKVREGDFKDGEFRLLNKVERNRIRLNGINDPGKAFRCIKMKKKKYVHQLYSGFLLFLEVGLIVIASESLKKTEYYTSLYCPNEKIKYEFDCINRCGDDCTLVYKDGLEAIDYITISLMGVFMLLTFLYLYWSCDPYYINFQDCINNLCKKLNDLAFGADTSEERYVNFSDSNSKEEEN